MAAPRRRVLVVLNETGYFRLYGSAIVELERRGWDVVLAYDRPGKRGGAEIPAGAGAGVRSCGAIPDVGHEGLLAILRTALDYIRYLEPRFAAAEYLRRRSEKMLPASLGWLTKVGGLPRAVVSFAIGLVRLLERVRPAERSTRQFLAALSPDLVFVSPLVTAGTRGGPQTEVIKAARSAGIPTVVGVASWDHLTSKGLIRIVPQAVTVWNDIQRHEATELHRIPASRIIVTGAQSLDHWFERADPDATTALRASLGLDPARPVVLFVGSSRNMAPGTSEIGFVRRWTHALRSAPAQVLSSAQILVRPHPSNLEQWRQADAAALGVAVYPLGYSGMPMSDAEVENFRHSILMSAAVVGVNTTAMIEAAILDRPVLTVRDADFVHSQAETLHFEHLATPERGCAVLAGSLEEHAEQLARVLDDPADAVARARRFVEQFVRPLGIDRPATDALCDAIEHVAAEAAATDAQVRHQSAAAATLARRGHR